jgi:hypothetical protein
MFARTRYAIYAVVASALCGMFIPHNAYGYATSFDYAVQAKWTNNMNFMLCLSSVVEKEYEELFIEAVEEWKSRWNHFGYTISKGSGCHINVHIVKTHSKVTDHGYVGYTFLEYWEHGAITKADIILPTYQKTVVTTVTNGKKATSEIVEPVSKTLFYRASLHEFGHALNLGHFEDNGDEPIDIMHPYPAENDQEQGISQRDIEALNWLYLGFFENEFTVRTDKKVYREDDSMKISGRVNPVMTGEVVKLEILDENKKIYASDTAAVDRAGTFTYKIRMPADANGAMKVKASYNGMIADAVFDVERLIQVKEVSLANPSIIEGKVTISETSFVDQQGSKPEVIRAEERISIRSTLVSTFPEQAEATCIMQIKDSQGNTLEVSSITYNLISGQSTFTQSWLPSEPGTYYIQIFLWKGGNTPEPLIPSPVELEVTVQ